MNEAKEDALVRALEVADLIRQKIRTPSPPLEDRIELASVVLTYAVPNPGGAYSTAREDLGKLIEHTVTEYYRQWRGGTWEQSRRLTEIGCVMAWLGDEAPAELELLFEAHMSGIVDGNIIHPKPIVPEKMLSGETRSGGRTSRIHCESGPAYIDGYGNETYALDGVIVPRQVVMAPDTLTLDDVIGCTNQEIRRVIISSAPARIFEGAGKVVHEDDTGQLWKCGFIDDEELALVRVIDASTDRIYWLRVPPEMSTAKEAVAWTFSMEATDYNPQVQT